MKLVRHLHSCLFRVLKTPSCPDIIIVLKEGEVVEQGTHDELMKARGLYYSMWQQQASLDAAAVDQGEFDEALALTGEEQTKTV